MAEEITDQWEKLKITEEEEEIAELEGSNDETQKSKIALSLVGKLLTVRSFNFEAFQNTMKQVWSLSRGVVFRKIENNLFIIQFFHWRDKEKVIDGAPWNFDNQLLLLKDVSGNEQPESIEITHCPFWIRLYNLPLDSRSDADVRTIAGKVGLVLEVEEDELGWDKSRRARVVVDVTKPLRRVQRVRNKQGSVCTVQFKYERLSTFCFMCGILGHTEKDCTNVEDGEEAVEKSWGLWLRASPRKGRGKLVEEMSKLKLKAKSLNFTHKPGNESSQKYTGRNNSLRSGGWLGKGEQDHREEVTEMIEEGGKGSGGTLTVGVEDGGEKESSGDGDRAVAVNLINREDICSSDGRGSGKSVGGDGYNEGKGGNFNEGDVDLHSFNAEGKRKVSCKGYRKAIVKRDTFDTIMKGDEGVILGKRERVRDTGQEAEDNEVSKKKLNVAASSGWREAEVVDGQPRRAQ